MSILDRGGLAAPGGVGLASMSFRSALGDLSFLFTPPLALSYTAEFFPTLAACFTLGGALGGSLSRQRPFRFGPPVAAFAVMEVVSRLRQPDGQCVNGYSGE